jgi:hypothetical protein
MTKVCPVTEAMVSRWRSPLESARTLTLGDDLAKAEDLADETLRSIAAEAARHP